MTLNPLWGLREWVTIDEAAEILSAGPGASRVSVADVFRLGLDGVLKLSVKLADTNAACFEQDKTEGPAHRATIIGVWDLPMIGPGQRQVEHEYHRNARLPFISMKGTPGAFVERDGLVCRVPADRGASGFSPRSASALPPDAVIVVRTAALRELQDMLLRVRGDAAREALGHPVSSPAPQELETEAMAQQDRRPPSAGVRDQSRPFDLAQQDLSTGEGRKTAVAAFLESANRATRTRVEQKHVWRAMKHTSSRQFQYWLKATPPPKGTRATAAAVRRILGMDPADFIALLARLGHIGD